MYAGMPAWQMRLLGLPCIQTAVQLGAACTSGGRQQSLSPLAPSSPVLAVLGSVQLRATSVRSAGSCVIKRLLKEDIHR